MIEGVIAQYLSANPELAKPSNGLGMYAGALAIFAARVPRDYTNLAIKIQSIATSRFDTRGKRGFITRLDVSVYGDKNGSYIPLRALADVVWAVLDRASLSPFVEATGYTVTTCLANAPFDHEDNEGFPACIVQVNATVLKQ